MRKEIKMPTKQEQSRIINYYNRGYTVEQILEIVMTVDEDQILEVIERFEEQFT